LPHRTTASIIVRNDEKGEIISLRGTGEPNS